MSESEEHRSLVVKVRDVLHVLHPEGVHTTHLQRAPGDPIPPRLGGFRPDVLIRDGATRIIADAKTDRDLDRKHTYDQAVSFVRYLERSKAGLFVLSVTARRADLAKTVLRFVYREIGPSRTKVAVFDECDLWLLQSNGVTWDIVLPQLEASE